MLMFVFRNPPFLNLLNVLPNFTDGLFLLQMILHFLYVNNRSSDNYAQTMVVAVLTPRVIISIITIDL